MAAPAATGPSDAFPADLPLSSPGEARDGAAPRHRRLEPFGLAHRRIAAPAAAGRDRPRSTAEPHVVRRRRWALHTNWTARPLFCAATNALLSANRRKVSAFTGSDLPERRFRTLRDRGPRRADKPSRWIFCGKLPAVTKGMI